VSEPGLNEPSVVGKERVAYRQTSQSVYDHWEMIAAHECVV